MVEDEPSIAGIIQYKLRREGHLVQHEATHARVAAAAAEFAPQLVVLDASLEGEGRSLIQPLLRWGPVLVLTEIADREGVESARLAGATATMEKPFKPTVLARRVHELLRSASRPAATP